MPSYKFGFNGNRYIDLIYFKEDAILTLADEAEDKVTSQPTEITHSPSLSPSLSSVKAHNLLPPLVSSTSTSSFRLPVADQPILQLATPSESGTPSDALPDVIGESEGETLLPAKFPILFSFGNILDSFIQHYIDLAFRYSSVRIQHCECCHRSLATHLWIKW